MAVWQKVITSGSNAAFASVSASNLTNTNLVMAGASKELKDSGITLSGNILALGSNSITSTGASSVLSGSFSGSFTGNGSGLTGVTATFPASAITTLGGSTQVFVNDGSNKYATVSQFNSSSWTGISGDITINSSGVATIAADSVALGTDTTGNYVQSLTAGSGITAFAAASEGAALTVTVSGSANRTATKIIKWDGSAFIDSNITDTGTQIQIGSGASSGLSVAAGGISVTGNSTFSNNLTVNGDLTINGTASFVNSTNLYVKDQFVLINSGSSTLTDSGIVSQYNTAGSGSAFYLEASSAGTYGRWAVAYDILGTSTSVTADEYVNTTKIGATTAVPTAAPTWGGSTNGVGNMYVTNDGQIYIWA